MPPMEHGFAWMRRVVRIAAVAVGLAAVPGPGAAACTREDFSKAVNEAGAVLRQLNAENVPRLQAKMRQLKTKMRWPDAGYEEKAFEVLQDERTAALDAGANDLLSRIDTLGTVDANAEPDCAKLQELTAASLELQATVKAKSSYLLGKIDHMLGEAGVAAPKSSPPPPKSAESKDTRAPAPKASLQPPPSKAAPEASPQPAGKPPESSAWSAETVDGPRREVAVAPPVGTPDSAPTSADDDGYSIEEIRVASAGFFGQVSTGLGAVIEHLFSKSGRPTGYVLGTEGGGALLAGVRYGKGTLYLRNGGTHQVYWHGPSLGTDVGAEGSKTLFLIYRMKSPEQIYASFTGIDGTAYFVGGVGATLITNGSVIMAPIRSGIGLRLGASLGYIRFTPRATWNPF
jgi:hypothetical protein